MNDWSGELTDRRCRCKKRWVGNKETGTGIRLTERSTELIAETRWSTSKGNDQLLVTRMMLMAERGWQAMKSWCWGKVEGYVDMKAG